MLDEAGLDPGRRRRNSVLPREEFLSIAHPDAELIALAPLDDGLSSWQDLVNPRVS
jgi:hypothetical protein